MSGQHRRPPRATATVDRPKWSVDDLVVVGSTRWIIRSIRGDRAELEASNVSPGIWWTTTVDNLPPKE